jgi:uncharacterized protein (TIGR02996 family)
VTVYDTEDWQSFVRAIAAAPDDDAPRLCAADWLDDRGEADRAELIRVQCRPAYRVSSVREASIADTGGAWLFAPWPATDDYSWDGAVGDGFTVRTRTVALYWRRGFVEAVQCPAADWLRHGDAALARHPVACVGLTTDLVTAVTHHTRAGADTATEWRCRLGPAATDVYVTRHTTDDDDRAAAGLADWADYDLHWRRQCAAYALSRRWPGVRFTLPAPPARDPDRVCTVTILDTVTGRLATDGNLGPYWWCEGNGSCDCNRLVALGLREPAGGVCDGATRCVVVAHDAPGYTLDEFNQDYPEELRAVARAWAAAAGRPEFSPPRG